MFRHYLNPLHIMIKLPRCCQRAVRWYEIRVFNRLLRSLTVTSLTSPVTGILENNPKMLRDLLEVRIGIECWSAYLAAKRATDEDIQKIGSYVDIMRNRVSEGWDPEVDSNFHDSIASATHNTMQIRILKTVHSLFLATIEIALHRFYASQAEYNTILLEQHQTIYDKIAERDPDGARTAMAEHLQWVQEKLPLILEHTV